METLKDSEDIIHCLNALKDKSPAKRLQAIRALGRLPLDPTIAVRSLARAVRDPDGLVRRAAVKAVAKAGAASIPALTAALASTDRQVRRRAASALAELGTGSRAMPALLQALGDADANVRRSAAQALGLLGAAARPAVPALTAALHDRDRVCCRLAAWALIQAGPEGIAALDQALFSGDEHVCGEALWALGQAGAKARAAIPTLAALIGLNVEPPCPTQREPAESAAGSLPSTAVVVIYRQPKGVVRLRAIRALGQISEAIPEARFVLAAATQHRDPGVRELAAAALRKIAPEASWQADSADTIQYWLQQASPSPAATHLPPPLADSA